jgi:hypothetical protein
MSASSISEDNYRYALLAGFGNRPPGHLLYLAPALIFTGKRFWAGANAQMT